MRVLLRNVLICLECWRLNYNRICTANINYYLAANKEDKWWQFHLMSRIFSLTLFQCLIDSMANNVYNLFEIMKDHTTVDKMKLKMVILSFVMLDYYTLKCSMKWASAWTAGAHFSGHSDNQWRLNHVLILKLAYCLKLINLYISK